MGMKIGICGVGRFATCFIPLFKAHPLVDELVLADPIAQRAKDQAKSHGITRVVAGLDELCDSDVDAIAIYTQRQLHGPQALQALDAGKHVYSAVPMAMGLDEITQIVDAVQRTGLLYMTGETSYYYPSTLYCRQRFQAGEMGKFVHADAQYVHDMDHFYASFQHSGGEQWKRLAGVPPMYYPTHSVSMVLSVTGARATQVSCLGFVDDHEDEIFRVGNNDWDNTFSNETALMRTSDGGSMRVSEMRRIGRHGGNSVYMNFFGTNASFEENAMTSTWCTKNESELKNVTEQVACEDMVGHEHLPGSTKMEAGDEFFTGVSSVHPVDVLPDSFKGLPNGHFGSHQFLVNDFVTAWSNQTLPPCHVWNAARWCVPGLIAHESAKQNGAVLEIPDFGQPPK